MGFESGYTRLGDLEVEGKLVLDDSDVVSAAVKVPEAVCRPGRTPSATEFRACVELCNALKASLNALIEAIT